MLFEEIEVKLGSKNLSVFDYLNSDLDEIVIKKISEKSGIKRLKLADRNEDAVSLVNSLLSRDIKNKLSNCQLIVVVSESKTQRIPPLSSLILNDTDTSQTLVLDLDSGCAGFVQSLQIVESFFLNKSYLDAAIITVDTYSKFIKKSNRSVSPIFGDGSSISFFKNNNRNSILSSIFGTYAEDYKSLVCTSDSAGLDMNGAEVFIFVKSKVIPSIEKAINRFKGKASDIDYFIIHQASKLVIDEIKHHFKIPDDKIFFEVQDTGNLVSTSIPFLLYKLKNKLKNNSKILLSGFGVGLTFSSLVIDYENNYS